MILDVPARDAHKAPGSRMHVIAGFVIAVTALGNAVVATRGSLYADDFRGSTLASYQPWSWDWLVGWHTSRHFAPFQRAHYSLFVEVAPLQHGFAVAVVTVELALAMAVFWLAARRLFTDGWALVAVILACMNPLITATFAWLVQAVALVGLLIGLHVALLALLLFLERPRRRWIAMGVVGWIIAALSWESWLTGPPLLFVLVILWQREGRFETRVVKAWRSAELFWVASAATVTTYLAVWKVGGYGTGGAWPALLDGVSSVWQGVYRMVVPSYAGGPWEYSGLGSYSPLVASSIPLVVLIAVLFTVLVSIAYRRDRVLALRGASVCIMVPAVTLILPVVGRSVQFPDVVALEPRYVASGMTVGCLGLVALLQALQPEQWSLGQRRVGLVAVCVVILGVALTDSRFVSIWSRNPSGAYVANARLDLAAHDPESGIFNTEVPASVLPRWAFLGLNSTREMLRPLVPTSTERFGAANSSGMFNEDGSLIPAQFYPLTWASLLRCTPVAPGETVEISLQSRQIHQDDLTLRVVAHAPGDGVLTYTVNDRGEKGDEDPRTDGPWGAGEIPVNSGELALTREGLDRYILLPPKAISSVTFTTTGTSACIESLAVGQPAP